MQGPARRILVVDDEATIREILVAALEDAGYVAVGASGGREMRAALKTGKFDLVVIDAVLPEERGLDLACSIMRRGLRALMITGDAFNMSGVVGLPSPILQKPFGSAEFIAKIEACLAAPA